MKLTLPHTTRDDHLLADVIRLAAKNASIKLDKDRITSENVSLTCYLALARAIHGVLPQPSVRARKGYMEENKRRVARKEAEEKQQVSCED